MSTILCCLIWLRAVSRRPTVAPCPSLSLHNLSIAPAFSWSLLLLLSILSSSSSGTQRNTPTSFQQFPMIILKSVAICRVTIVSLSSVCTKQEKKETAYNFNRTCFDKYSRQDSRIISINLDIKLLKNGILLLTAENVNREKICKESALKLKSWIKDLASKHNYRRQFHVWPST